MSATPNSGVWHASLTRTPNATDLDHHSAPPGNFAHSFDSVAPAFIDSPFTMSEPGLSSSHLLNSGSGTNTSTNSVGHGSSNSPALPSSRPFEMGNVDIATALHPAGLGGGDDSQSISLDEVRRLLAEQSKAAAAAAAGGMANASQMHTQIPQIQHQVLPQLHLGQNDPASLSTAPQGMSAHGQANLSALTMSWPMAAMPQTAQANAMPFVAADPSVSMMQHANASGGNVPRNDANLVQPASMLQTSAFDHAAAMRMFPHLSSEASAQAGLSAMSTIPSMAQSNGAAILTSMPPTNNAAPIYMPPLNGNVAPNGALQPATMSNSANSGLSIAGPSSSAVSVFPRQSSRGASVSETSDVALQKAAKPRRSTIGGSTAGTTRRTKFKRSRTGCLVCRKRKVKCDQDGMPCKQCRIGTRDCHYEEFPLKRRRKGKSKTVGSVDRVHVQARGHQSDNGTRSSSSSAASSTLSQSPHIFTAQSISQPLSQQLISEKLTAAAKAQLQKGEGHALGINLYSTAAEVARKQYGQGEGEDKVLDNHSLSLDGTDDASTTFTDTWNSFKTLGGGNKPDDWNSTTPSTGATSVQTADGEHYSSDFVNGRKHSLISTDVFGSGNGAYDE